MKKIAKFSIFLAFLAITITGCNQTKSNTTVNSVENGETVLSYAELAAVKIKLTDGNIIFYTHDTKNQRLRVDVSNTIILMDYKNKDMAVYSGIWMNIPWNPGAAPEDYFDRTSEEKIVENGYIKTGTMTVIGKLCDVYAVLNTDTTVVTKCAIWNGITLWIEENGKVIYEALAVTLNIPDNFFEQTTIENNWIE